MTFSVALHLVGGFCSSAVPSPRGPRHAGQFSAWAVKTLSPVRMADHAQIILIIITERFYHYRLVKGKTGILKLEKSGGWMMLQPSPKPASQIQSTGYQCINGINGKEHISSCRRIKLGVASLAPRRANQITIK